MKYSVPELGWSGIKNGDLLKQMQDKGLEILLSIDKNMSHQQNLEKYSVSLLVFDVRDTRYDSPVPFVAKTEELLKKEIPLGLTIID